MTTGFDGIRYSGTNHSIRIEIKFDTERIYDRKCSSFSVVVTETF